MLFGSTLEKPAAHTMPCIIPHMLSAGTLQKNEEIVLFGGELWSQDTHKVHVYDDVYTFNPTKERWTHIRSRGPHPRSACAGAIHKNCLYVFGGEFTSPNQEKFRHFRCVKCAKHKSAAHSLRCLLLEC
jgi:N-acetylneuraminic acid mutarotase